MKKSTVSCDKKCSGKASNVELVGDNTYTVSFQMRKGKGRIQKATVEIPQIPSRKQHYEN